MKGIFSIYRQSADKAFTPQGESTLEQTFARITAEKGSLRDVTDKLRELRGDSEEYKKLKREGLPSATFGGVFDYRSSNLQKLSEKGKRGLLSPSGFVTIDIDHISQTSVSLEDLKRRLSEDQESGVRLVFTSPSGDGLKVICKVSSGITDKDSYKEVYNRLKYYLEERFRVEIDSSGSDITRLCFLCYDPSAIYRDWKCEFDPDRHPVPERPQSTPVPSRTFSQYEGNDGIDEIVRRVEESGKDIAPDYETYIKLVYSFTALGERGRGLLHRVCSLSPKYNREDTDKDWDYCNSNATRRDIGDFVNVVKDSGINVNDYNNLRGGSPYVPGTYRPQTSGGLRYDRKAEDGTKEE